jgi:hypothetical protein
LTSEAFSAASRSIVLGMTLLSPTELGSSLRLFKHNPLALHPFSPCPCNTFSDDKRAVFLPVLGGKGPKRCMYGLLCCRIGCLRCQDLIRYAPTPRGCNLLHILCHRLSSRQSQRSLRIDATTPIVVNMVHEVARAQAESMKCQVQADITHFGQLLLSLAFDGINE